MYTSTLVIPALNESKSIRAFLESAITQSKPFNTIVVVIDHATTDDTKQICDEYTEFGVQTIINSPSGVSRARAAGFEVSDSDIIVSSDADSVLPFNWHKNILKSFEDYPSSSLIYGSVELDPHEVRASIHLLAKLGFRIFLRTAHSIGSPNPNGMNFAIKREIYNKINGFDVKRTTAEDIDLAKRASQHGKITYQPSIIVFTSARRLRGMGYRKFLSHHMKNYIGYNFAGQSSDNFKAYRD
ncbi:MAG: glycosyltransferase [bacterium]